jgi:hypothetical protein
MAVMAASMKHEKNGNSGNGEMAEIAMAWQKMA